VGSGARRTAAVLKRVVCEDHVAPKTVPPADRTKLEFLVARTNSAQHLLLPSGMHTKKLERYRED
jgi:hypothetical protein